MLDEYRLQLVDFCTTWMRENYLYLAGHKAALEVSRIYEEHADLFSLDSIARLRSDLSNVPQHLEVERAAVSRLLLFGCEQFLEYTAKDLTEQISEREARLTLDFSGRPMTFQEASAALRTQKDRDARRAIYRSRAKAIESSNDLRAERLSMLRSAARMLGYDTYLSAQSQLRQFDYASLAQDADALLSQTEDIFVSNLDRALRRSLDLRLDQVERADAFYFLHLTMFDDHFPAGGLLASYEQTLSGLGIDVKRQENISFDTETRPQKTPRAFCMPIVVPDEIKMVIRPMGGQSDYQTLLHEGGHAQHYAWTSGDLRPEFKYTGDYGLTESYAFLFNHLISNRAWLESVIGFEDSSDFIRQVMLTRLFQARRYVAKLQYELELHSGIDLELAGRRYADLQTAATKFETESTEFLFDIDDGFYSANYVRAWAFEVILREYLMTNFGRNWWTSRRAGDLLKELWETGDRYTADQMAEQLGIAPIGFEPLIQELNQCLE